MLQVIAATNRIDILDPALLRSGRLDRKIEFPLPNESARARILEIHSRKMTTSPDVNFEELARSTDEFNGAQLKAVCVEAGMIALREGATKLGHEHFLSGIAEGELILSCTFVPPSDHSTFKCKARRRTIWSTSLSLPRSLCFHRQCTLSLTSLKMSLTPAVSSMGLAFSRRIPSVDQGPMRIFLRGAFCSSPHGCTG